MQKPSVGRVVHYQRFGSPCGTHKPEASAAIITKVIDKDTKKCQLFVMNPNGLYHNETPYSEMPKPGHWSWPPRDREFRKDDEGQSWIYDEASELWMKTQPAVFHE